MPQVIYTEESKQDLVRFADFLVENDAKSQAKALINLILSSVILLENHPLVGRVYSIEEKEFRELKIKYGRSGYVCLYSYNSLTDVVLIHAFRHQRELGYH